jgi:GH24 family phage-related lysozyme (muramidase)
MELPVKEGDVISAQKNDEELYNILNKSNEFLKTRPVYSSLNPNQIAGLLDTTYNIGTGWTKAKNGKLLDVTADSKK